MKLTGTLNAYLDTSDDHKVTKFADAITSGNMSAALGALTLTNFNYGILPDMLPFDAATVTVDGPEIDKNEIINKAIAVMRDKRNEILAEAQAKATAIDAKIQNLLAIGYTPSTENIGVAPVNDDGITDVEMNQQ